MSVSIRSAQSKTIFAADVGGKPDTDRLMYGERHALDASHARTEPNAPMIRGLFSRRRRPARRPTVPDGLRVYAVGDIHGRADLLERLHEKMRDDGQLAPADIESVVVYLGDYVDRGMDSRGVMESLLASRLGGFAAVHLKGNHEDC